MKNFLASMVGWSRCAVTALNSQRHRHQSNEHFIGAHFQFRLVVSSSSNYGFEVKSAIDSFQFSGSFAFRETFQKTQS